MVALRSLSQTCKKDRKTEKISEPEQLAREFFTSVHPPVTSNGYSAVLPYIKGLTEPLNRVLRKYDIRGFNKSVGTLQQDFHSSTPLKIDLRLRNRLM